MCWVVTASTALVATAASAALPPGAQHRDACRRREVVDRADHAARCVDRPPGVAVVVMVAGVLIAEPYVPAS